MLRPSLTTAAAALLGASAVAQSGIDSRLLPVTVPTNHIGVYHVETGTWTRNGQLAYVTGPDTIYNNSCYPGYYTAMITGEKFQHSARIPTTAANGAPTTVSVFTPTKNDEAPGCQTSYLVNGFQISYCTRRNSILGPFAMDFEFADSYLSAACGANDLVPTVTINVPNLLPGTSTGGLLCHIFDVDLGTSSFTLQADGDGTYIGPSDTETFGWSLSPTTAGMTTAQATGPRIAGNFSWTGGPAHPNLQPCSGTDGTIWDSPINLAESGTGMASNDFFRATGTTTLPSGPGCYTFTNTNIHADFWLKLYSDANCALPSPMVQNCFPGTGSTVGCPCGQPANPAGGCANFGATATTGAKLNASGTPSLAADTLLLTTTNHRTAPAAGILNVFFTSTGTSIPNGVANGAGVRCYNQTLKRLYTGQTSPPASGSLSKPAMGDPSVSARSAALGSAISAGQTRHYFNIYRDQSATAPAACNNTASNVNVTNAGSILWGP